MAKARKNLWLEESLVKKAEMQAIVDGINLSKITEKALEKYLSKATLDLDLSSSRYSFTSSPTPITQKMKPNDKLKTE